jgi:phage terminase large subunit-like protein
LAKYNSFAASERDDDLSSRFYLLHAEAFHGSYDTLYNKVFEVAKKFRIHKVGFETVAAQKYAAHHIEYLNTVKDWHIKIQELKGEVEGADGTVTRKKEWRIRNVLAPIFEEGRMFVKRTQQDFIGEYNTFPRGKYVDLLDALAYAPQMLRHSMSYADNSILLSQNQQRAQKVNAPYCSGGTRVQ